MKPSRPDFVTYWIYLGSRIVHCVRLPPNAQDGEVKWKALCETDDVPGVVCDFPRETPREHRCAIRAGRVVG